MKIPTHKLNLSIPVSLLSLAIAGCSSTSSDEESDTSSNESSSTGTIIINEIVAKDANDGHDWFELYVTEGTVNLANYMIIDNDESHEAQSLPDITLEAGDFIVIEAIDEDDTATEGSYSVNFKLGSSDALTLSENGDIISSLSWEDGEAESGYSYGLLPDDSGTTATLSPTKGYENEVASNVDIEILDTIVSSYPDLVINEIVAKSTSDLGDGSDWVELYVTSDTNVNLSDYTLRDSDSETGSALPNITLAPGEFYTLFATDDELEDLETVNFKLGSSDSVSLFKDDDLIDYIEWDKGEALLGFSYGRYTDGNGAHKTLSPSMNINNIEGARGPLVINEVVTKASEGNDWFELYNNGSEAIELGSYSVIDESDDIEAVFLPSITLAAGEYLTIQATDEDPGSDYVPFKLGSSDSLSLILNDETVDYLEWDDSDAPQTYSYGLYPDGAWTQQTLIPTESESNELANLFDNSSVENIYLEISTTDWQDLLDNPLEENNYSANLNYKDITLENIAIRTKGNSSLSAVANSASERYSFKLDMNEYVDGQKFLNLKKLNLNNNYKDPTYMRDTLAYNLMREMGLPAPRTTYANVYINGDLHGLYTLVEQVDSEFLERNFENADGDLYKPDSTDVVNGVGHDLIWIDELISSYTAVELKTNEDTTDHQALINFLDVLNNNNDDLLAIEQAIDVDAMLRYIAVSTALGNLDSYQGPLAHNYYLYESSNQFSVIPWDMNESFGTFTMGCSADALETMYIDEPTSGALSERPLIASLLQDDDYLEDYHDHLATLITNGLDPDNLEQSINETADLIRDAVYADPSAFYSATEFETSLNTDVSGIPGLLSFTTNRVESILDQLDGTTPSSGDGSGICSTDAGGGPGDIGGGPGDIGGGPGGQPMP